MIGVCHVVCRKERECYLLAFNSVTSTPQWICQREPRNVHDVCVLVCKGVYVCPKYVCFSPGALHSRTSLLMPFLVFRRSHLASCREDSR